MWLGMLVVVLLAFALTRTRRKTTHPYPNSTHWRDRRSLPRRRWRPTRFRWRHKKDGCARQPSYGRVTAKAARGGLRQRGRSGERSHATHRWPVPADPGGPTGPGNPPGRLGRQGRYDTSPAFERPAMGARPVGPGNSARDWRTTAPDGLAAVGRQGGAGPAGPDGPDGPRGGHAGGAPVDRGLDSLAAVGRRGGAGPAGPDGPRGGHAGGAPVDRGLDARGSQSGAPRWFDRGTYHETGTHGDRIPGRAAQSGAIPGREARGGAAPGRSASPHGADATAETASWATDTWWRQDNPAQPPWPDAPMPKLDAESRYRDQVHPYDLWPGEVDRR